MGLSANNDLENIWKEAILAFAVAQLRKTMPNLSHDSRSRGSRFEPWASQIRSSNAAYSAVTFGYNLTVRDKSFVILS
jgi:hypothetical protein